MELGIGEGRINFRLRDAIFSRQRYWGEPFPVYYKDGMPYTLDEEELTASPAGGGRIPAHRNRRTSPCHGQKTGKPKRDILSKPTPCPVLQDPAAITSAIWIPRNEAAYFSREAVEYWQDVDLYIGGDEHATGHLIYSRFWNKFLFDIGLTVKDEPYKKLINQGKIQGRSSIVYRIKGTNTFVSLNLKDRYETNPMHVDISFVDNDILDIEAFRKWRPDLADAEFILEDGQVHLRQAQSKRCRNRCTMWSTPMN